jgi:transglutaminase-like putative cysteine protease
MSESKWELVKKLAWIKTAKAITFTFLILLSFSPDSNSSGIIYRNPRPFCVNYTFELIPEPEKINRNTDLKVWIPVPREWDSQKAVEILSVEPEPLGRYVDPEHGNLILFWDFGKGPEQASYKVNIKYRLEAYEIHAEIDPEQVRSYDKTGKEYILYTRSSHSVSILPAIREMAAKAIGKETNPYLQAKKIFDFVREKMRFKMTRHTRGSDIHSILDFPVINKETGKQYYEGQCDHFSLFFVALCRAAGIPARCVLGNVGWAPWIKKEDLKLNNELQKELSPQGLAAARAYGPFGGHIWAEFFLPGYGWIPADPTWGRFGSQINYKFILSKGRDVKIGPYAPQETSEGYGDQWIPLHQGRANAIGYGVWNISKIRIANAKYLQTADPFPAAGYAQYAEQLYPEQKEEEKLLNWRKELLLAFYNTARKNQDNSNIFADNPRLDTRRQAYICHLLRQIVGDENFHRIFQSYLDLRTTSGRPVSTEKFQDIAEDYYGKPLNNFFQQWVDSSILPRFRLQSVKVENPLGDRRVTGEILLSNADYDGFPIELVLKTTSGQKKQKIWLDSKKTGFEFYTMDQPRKLMLDPAYNIPTIRWMPPQLNMLWNFYPDITVIYGTVAEAEANKTAAEFFTDQYLGLKHDIIRADSVAGKEELKSQCLILFGRPETNRIGQKFRQNFIIKFDKNMFSWQGKIYDQPLQGVAQIIENPVNPAGVIILYAGLSGEATQNICDKSEWRKELEGNFLIDVNNSFIIFDGHKKLDSGDWEDHQSDLVWEFN